ncbi:MAG: peptidylprolyl isomerase [Polyangiaceae bacterium]|jgi:cyclophilin family peptidyl-prolyl cis-trans isomerase
MGDLERAEDMRRAQDVPARVLSSDDPLLRRRATRALARILDADDSPLLAALADEDDETMAWSAYGLGESCREQQDSHVRALAARLVSLDPGERKGQSVDALRSVLRALGRCASVAAERTLAAWLARRRQTAAYAEEAAYALADTSVARGSLVPETVDVLLEAAQGPPPLDAALYAFGRTDVGMGARQKERLGQAVRDAITRPGPYRMFAVRALERLGTDGVGDLTRVLTGDEFTAAERAEAARALARLDQRGVDALERALGSLVPSSIDSLSAGTEGILLAMLQGIPVGGAGPADAALRALAGLSVGADAPAVQRSHASVLRCGAAAKFAAWDSEVARSCDLADGVRGKLARLDMLDRTALRGARREAWLSLMRAAEPVRVREAALALLGRHPEASDAAPTALSAALAAPEPGVVAVAAEILNAHPERAVASQRAATRSSPDSAALSRPRHETSARVLSALRAALARPWAEDLVEPTADLIEASLAVGLGGARESARAACESPNPSLRARVARALETVGEPAALCRAPTPRDRPAPEAGHCLSQPVRVLFDSDSGTLDIRFDPALAPVEATRLVALARSGFYGGAVLHRTVPGTIVQLGDPDADGYGGAGRLMRSETSPVPFGLFDVGVALSGRDTGSGQVFVALARSPNLDGRYPWVGRADGDWESIVDGDVVRSVRVEP